MAGNCNDSDVRLVGGTDVTTGRVDYCINNAWGTVCNNRFGTNEAIVICRQLGFSQKSEFKLVMCIMWLSYLCDNFV